MGCTGLAEGWGELSHFCPLATHHLKHHHLPTPLHNGRECIYRHVSTHVHTHTHKYVKQKHFIQLKLSGVPLGFPSYIRMKEGALQHVFQCQEFTFKHTHYTGCMCHMIKGKPSAQVPDEKEKTWQVILNEVRLF